MQQAEYILDRGGNEATRNDPPLARITYTLEDALRQMERRKPRKGKGVRVTGSKKSPKRQPTKKDRRKKRKTKRR